MKKIKYFLILFFTIHFSCNEVPVKNLITSLTMQVQDLREKSPPVKLDILWVIDDSPSMCQEQKSLAKSFHIFTDILKKYATIDAKIAVTTTNICPAEKGGVRGTFVYQPAMTFPPACFVTEVLDCLEDKKCNDILQGQKWTCKHPEAKNIFSCDKPDDNKENKLVVINSSCTYRCKKDDPAECPYLFGYPEECKKVCEQSTNCLNACGDLFFSDPENCKNVCDVDHTCGETCENYFNDNASCNNVCSSDNCFNECEKTFINVINTQSKKLQNFGESFPCYGSCKAKSEYSCKDQCIMSYGEPEYRCIWPGESEANSGCLFPPTTKYCPQPPQNIIKTLDRNVVEKYYDRYKNGEWKGVPEWKNITDDELLKEKIFEYLFMCMATVGAEQQVCGNQEQPLLAAWMALDGEGENKAQAKEFLREEAYLLIIFVGDEDDCSTAYKINAEDYSRCPCLTTTDEGGPLYPVSYFVNKFKTLKKDPAMVLVAAISGDLIPDSSTTPLPSAIKDQYKSLLNAISVAKDEEKKQLESQLEDLLNPYKEGLVKRYFECKCDKKNPTYSQGTYICLSKQGKADYGRRFFELVKAFSAKKITDLAFGVSANICSDKGFDEAMEKIAKTVLPIIAHICLPRPFVKPEWIEVSIIKSNNEKIPQVKDKDYDLIQSLRCGAFKPNAVQFKYPLDITDRLEIIYKADPLWIPQE